MNFVVISSRPHHTYNDSCERHLQVSSPLTVSLPSWFASSGVRDIWGTGWKADAKPNEQYTGQDQEDKYAYETFFAGIIGGTYLEIGGLDGKTLSNTHWFHEQLGWRGILIEPNPFSYSQLVRNRPSDIDVNAAVCSEAMEVHWAEKADMPAMHGIYEFMSPTFKQHAYPNADINKMKTISCVPMASILAKFGVKHIDFFSLDVEGAELQVLESIDFNCVTFDVITIEDLGGDEEKVGKIKVLLESKGYIFHAKVERNNWFVRNGSRASKTGA